MILYGSILSPFVRKVVAFASEKGVALELRTVGLNSDDVDFRETSPLGKMPGFRDGDFALSDSTAIAFYLDAVAPGAKLIPDEARARARTVWWDEFADTMLFAAVQPVFFNRIVSPLFLRRPGDEAVAAKAEREGLPRLLEHLERSVADADLLVGDGLTLADVAVGSVFVNVLHCGLGPDPATYPRAAAYVARIHARTSFAAGIAKEQAAIARAREAA